MKNKKLIIMSAALALAAGGIAVGGTYALFTSNAANNVTVSAGKVAITSALSLVSVKSGDVEESIVKNAATFANGGSVSIVGNQVVISKMTPKDYVKFTITPTNASNVKIKYRTVLAASGSLVSGLDIKINGSAMSGYVSRSEWKDLSEGEALPSDASKTFEISLPRDAGNEYQEKTAKITANVEAIQANGELTHYVEDTAAKTLAINDEEGMDYFREQANSGAKTWKGYTVSLKNDLDMEYEQWDPIGHVVDLQPGSLLPDHAFEGLFDGENHTISHLNASTLKAPVGLFSEVIAENVSNAGVKNLTISNSSFEGEDTAAISGISYDPAYTGAVVFDNINVLNTTISGKHYTGAIFGYQQATGTISNIKVDGCHISATADLSTNENYKGNHVGGIAGLSNAAQDYSNITISNTDITGYRDVGGVLATYMGSATMKLSTVTLKNVNITADQSVNSYGAKDFDIGATIPQLGTPNSVVESGISKTNVVLTTIDINGVKTIL